MGGDDSPSSPRISLTLAGGGFGLIIFPRPAGSGHRDQEHWTARTGCRGRSIGPLPSPHPCGQGCGNRSDPIFRWISGHVPPFDEGCRFPLCSSFLVWTGKDYRETGPRSQRERYLMRRFETQFHEKGTRQDTANRHNGFNGSGDHHSQRFFPCST